MTAARGVDVRIIVPKNNNHPFVAQASQSFYRSLITSGVRVFEKKGNFSHAKAMLAGFGMGVHGFQATATFAVSV